MILSNLYYIPLLLISGPKAMPLKILGVRKGYIWILVDHQARNTPYKKKKYTYRWIQMDKCNWNRRSGRRRLPRFGMDPTNTRPSPSGSDRRWSRPRSSSGNRECWKNQHHTKVCCHNRFCHCNELVIFNKIPNNINISKPLFKKETKPSLLKVCWHKSIHVAF